MNRTFVFHIVVIPFLIFLSATLAFWAANPDFRSPPPVKNKSEPAHPLRIVGMDFSSHIGARLSSRIKADEVIIGPRKFTVFTIRKINELTMNNVNLEVYQQPDAENKSPFLFVENTGDSVSENLCNDEQFGLVSRGKINNIVIKMFNEQEPFLIITAAKVIVDFYSNDVTLQKAKIQHIPSQKHIFSETIYWDKKNKFFKIPGEYFARTPKGSLRDKKIQFDVNFVVSPLV